MSSHFGDIETGDLFLLGNAQADPSAFDDLKEGIHNHEDKDKADQASD